MKRRRPDGEPDGESYLKRRRGEDEDFGDEALNLAQSLASVVVGQRLQEWLDVGSGEQDDAVSFFFGQPQDFIEQSLFGGEPGEYIFGTPDESFPGTPESSDEEFEYDPETPEMDEDFLSDPEQYAWDLAMEMSNEIIDELYDENVVEDSDSMIDEDVKKEFLELHAIATLQVEICQEIYSEILAEWSSSYAS